MNLTKDGDKYIKTEYEALAAELAGTPLEQAFYLDMYRFACWVLMIDELKPADKMAYIAEITGIGVTRKRVDVILGQPTGAKPSAGAKPAAPGLSTGSRAPGTAEPPEIIRLLTEQDIATGNTFGPEAESMAERCLRLMELFAYGICTVGRRKFSRLEKETVESYISSQRAEMRRAFERAEKATQAPRPAPAERPEQAEPPGGRSQDRRRVQQRRQNPMSNAARDRLIAEFLQEPAPETRAAVPPLQAARGRRLLVTSVIAILAGVFLVALVILLINESRSNVAVLESYTGTDYTREQIASFIAEQKGAQRESLLNILWTALTQILPGILAWVSLKMGQKPLAAAEALSLVGLVRTAVMLVIGPSWMALAELPQILLLVFAGMYRRCLKGDGGEDRELLTGITADKEDAT